MVQTKHPESEIFRWLAVTGKEEQIIGYARISFATPKANNYENAKHTAGFDILVAKDFRRNGLGTALFKVLLEKALEFGRISVFSAHQVTDLGYAFCEKFLGKVVQEEAEFRAYLSEINWELMKTWKTAGDKLAEEQGIILEKFEKCPDHLIDKYTDIYTETLNQRPLGEIEIRHRITPESRKAHEKSWIDERGHKWNSIVTIESDGTISGLTEMVYIPESTVYIEQLLTGVKEEYRGRGLGKWLKAEMAFFIKENYPELKYIITDNADVNDPMLSINERMNFKRTQTLKTYHFDVNNLTKLLIKNKKK
jgi:GNAT superfamily N-acetyltransferase